MAFQISGNVQAVNALIRLRAVFPGPKNVLPNGGRTYSDASGNYSFSSIPAGVYEVIANLSECITAPYNTGYTFRRFGFVTMDAAGDNIANLNFTPVALNAANPPNGAL